MRGEGMTNKRRQKAHQKRAAESTTNKRW